MNEGSMVVDENTFFQHNKQLTIIIPVYNMALFLLDCINSLERQHFDDSVEIIFIDDGSTDDSPLMLDKAVAKNSNMKVIHQKNAGVATARNIGLEHSCGKYVAWVDPDDYITNDWWSTIQPLLNENPEMIYFDMIIKKGEKEHPKYFAKQSYILGHNELCNELAKDDKMQSHLWSKIILRPYYLRTLEKRGYIFDHKLSFCEDFEALHYICWPVSKCMYIHKPLYIYRQRTDSIVNNKQDWLTNSLLAIKLYQERYDFYCQHGIKISDIGILSSKTNFIIVYSLYATDIEKIKCLQIYKKCRCDFRKFAWKLLTYKGLSWPYRLNIVSVFLGVEKIYFKLKEKIKLIIRR